MPIETGTQSYIDSSGALTQVPDLYKNVTQNDVARAEAIEKEIFANLGTIEAAYIRVGACLVAFEDERLYLAKGLSTFNEWLQADIKMSKRQAHDLMRIIREALPVLQKNNLMQQLPNVSTMRALLPMLAEGEDKFVQAVGEIQGMTIQDVYSHLKDMRGITDEYTQVKFFVDTNRNPVAVKVMFMDQVQSYDLGTLRMTAEQWRILSRFYSGQTEYV